MAPATSAKPKRKRQRRRQASISSASGSSSSDSESESEPTPASTTKIIRPAPPSVASSSEASSDSSTEEESSEDEKTKRKNRGKANALAAAAAAQSGSVGASGGGGEMARRPYPSRSPSPITFNPANVPLGLDPFPSLRALVPGAQILVGHVPGDEGFVEGSVEKGKEVELDLARVELEREKEERFGEWWRARLVSEFEKELGGLAAEPGLTAPRLSLLLTSLTTLSSLHTTSSALSTSKRSIWLHDPNSAIDPLAVLETEEGTEEWGKTKVGGEGDVQVGEEGVRMDQGGKDGMEIDP